MTVLRILRGLVLAAVLAALIAPEFRAYRAERLLRLGTEALRQLLAHPSEVADPSGALSRIEQIALSAASSLPGDPRPWLLAGGTRLVGGEPDKAILFYRHAIELGERAEIDINLGRAYEARGDTPKSRAAFLRGIWISPPLIDSLLPDVAAEIAPEIKKREELLGAGKLAAPPPLPD
jgi:cytochrome c-type biogenesis protein CcmH/NrfG